MSRLWSRYQPVLLPDEPLINTPQQSATNYRHPNTCSGHQYACNHKYECSNHCRSNYRNSRCYQSAERPIRSNATHHNPPPPQPPPSNQFDPEDSYRGLYSRRTHRSRQTTTTSMDSSHEPLFPPYAPKYANCALPLSAEHPRVQSSYAQAPAQSTAPAGHIDLDSMFLRNGYKLGEKLGKGSFAVVKRVSHIASGRELAVKIVDHNLATKEFLHKFLLRELNIIRVLKHPNIIFVDKIVRIGSYTCVIMEEAKKGDLLECVLKRGFLSEKESRKILRGISKALLFCHQNNIAHRDLKCENILLDEHGDAKLSDFGFARSVLDSDTQKRLLSKTYCGSAAYVAPEVLRGQPYNPMMSDVWSLGVILFIMLTGLMPFDDSNLPRMVQVQIKKKWSFPSGRKELIAHECQALVKHMLEPDITLRITMNQMSANEWVLKNNDQNKEQ